MAKTKRVAIYLRVSTTDQTVANQRQDLMRVAEQRGWQVVQEYVDHGYSGAKGRDKRPAFDRMCKDAAHGKIDMVAAWAIDRIGRSLKHLVDFIEELQAQHVGLYLHQQQVDTSTASGAAMFGMCSVFAQFERSIIVERINAGIARARKQGKHLGRPTTVTYKTEQRIRDLRSKGYGKIRIGRELGCGTSTVQRVLAA